jgi:hypothetical protein
MSELSKIGNEVLSKSGQQTNGNSECSQRYTAGCRPPPRYELPFYVIRPGDFFLILSFVSLL